ncbi:MAG: ABC transporter ATP-binding protein [Candidatus Zixiibacteriota bacterium]
MPENALIKLEKLEKYYKMGKTRVHALRGIDLNIDRGEYLAVMGPSGSGKSTLMNILGFLDVPSSGKYFFEDDDVSSLSDNQLASIRNEHVGFVFQTFNLLPRMNALKNVELPLIYAGIAGRDRRARAQEMLEEVGLGDRVDHRPNELSGGQQQRVAIARALICNPDIIFADEPTGNLDTNTGDEIMDILDKLYDKGNTIILVTHENEIAERAKRIIHLRDGLIESDK